MYFLVNASPKQLQTLQVHRSHDVEVCNLDPKLKVKGKKGVFAMVYHQLLL